jgi:hypothetical protein
MPLSPPSDFHPPADRSADEPTNEELRALWDASERRRQERARETGWRRLRETARRTAADTVVARICRRAVAVERRWSPSRRSRRVGRAWCPAM